MIEFLKVDDLFYVEVLRRKKKEWIILLLILFLEKCMEMVVVFYGECLFELVVIEEKVLEKIIKV